MPSSIEAANWSSHEIPKSLTPDAPMSAQGITLPTILGSRNISKKTDLPHGFSSIKAGSVLAEPKSLPPLFAMTRTASGKCAEERSAVQGHSKELRKSSLSSPELKRPSWNSSTKVQGPKGAEAMPGELEKRGAFWGDIQLAREMETSEVAIANRKYLADSRLSHLMRGGAQSKATKAFRMHPRVWSLVTQPARPEVYHRYAKMEHDRRDVSADWVDSGVQRAMLRMKPQIQTYLGRWRIPDHLRPAVLEIRQILEHLQDSGGVDESLKHELIKMIQDSFHAALIYEGRNVMTIPAMENATLQARVDSIDQMKRELISFLEGLRAEATGPSQDFRRDAVIQQVQCFLATALLESSKPFSSSGLKQT